MKLAEQMRKISESNLDEETYNTLLCYVIERIEDDAKRSRVESTISIRCHSGLKKAIDNRIYWEKLTDYLNYQGFKTSLTRECAHPYGYEFIIKVSW